jgi:hypothetical protein
MTAIENEGRFGWKDRFRSVVTNTLKCFRRKGQQAAILDGCPAHLPSGLNIVADDVTGQAPVDTLVEKNLHDAASTTNLGPSPPPGKR